ncbi:class I SAM-dependent methyltransferase [Silvibacterium acidisoli]|uniref:class I SAM-dependent methyltransferase n=1 Tax=Acidobacteriaceae bacterium ZG23-2 TaxID=2883246 RepID=UPI00406C72D0
MHEAQPSRTALRVALRRAAHQLFDTPVVFEDPMAVPILGSAYAAELERTPRRSDRPYSTGLRAFLVARSRYAEENLRSAVESGVRQYVLLGAGLDTFGYRNPYPGLQVFEVDHPATQAWKQELLTRNNIPVPASTHHVPVDFERQSLTVELQHSGFDPNRPACFAWLGVVPYLTPEAFRATLGFIAERPAGSGVTLDYAQPRSVLPFHEQLAHDSIASRVQLSGEPFRQFFTPEEMAHELSAFNRIEDLGTAEINARYFSNRSDGFETIGKAPRLLSAWKDR